MSKAVRLTVTMACAAILIAVDLWVGGIGYWVGVGALVFGVGGLGWTLMRYTRGDWPRPHAIVNGLWSLVGVNVGLYFLLEVDWLLLGYAILAAAAVVYQRRYDPAGPPRSAPEGSVQ